VAHRPNNMYTEYIYCFSHPAFGVKIGVTNVKDKRKHERNPDDRLQEANNTPWVTPEWKMDFAKAVLNAKAKEKQIHEILHYYRIDDSREMFRVDVALVKQLFNLLDGEWWEAGSTPEPEDADDEDYDYDDEDDEGSSEDEDEEPSPSKRPRTK
jgi:T5orf172 domain